MGVVKNLMIRIGADYSDAKKGMDGASKELEKFKRDTTRKTSEITGKKGLGGVGGEFKSLGSIVTSSLSSIKGAKGIDGISVGLKALRPVIGAASSGLAGLAVSAGGVTAALGPAALGVAAITAAIALVTAGVYAASQAAVKFEADLGRVNMQLKGGTREFMQWARSQGLAKSTAAELGATYSVLLSSFTKDSKLLQDQTKQISQATRVVASATGRSIEDTLERMRSGLLGNTEAIEDLGIFVGVSMIESTKAFKKFAGDKSWDQLDFRVQQQIRLAAILEQAYDRYGDKLQNNVMTKQEVLMEQLKDVKLNLSQAFLPIWDLILPTLTKLATALADVTERIARFVYWLRGWDYDEKTSGLNQQTDAVTGMGDAYSDLGKEAKKAKQELASFDQLNLIGDSGSGGGNGSTGGGTGSGTSGGKSSGGDSGDGIKLPEIPPALNKKWGIEFDTPNPPDAGAGAVVTAVNTTIDGLVAETKKKTSEMWDELNLQTETGVQKQELEWKGLSDGLTQETVPVMSSSITGQFSELWGEVQLQSETTAPIVSGNWKTALDTMNSDLLEKRPMITSEWTQINDSVSSISEPLSDLRTDWNETLDYQQSQLNAYGPYIEYGWSTMQDAIANTSPVLDETQQSWAENLSSMQESTSTELGQITADINKTTAAWRELQRALNQPTSQTSSAPESPMYGPVYEPSVHEPMYGPEYTPSAATKARNIPYVGAVLRGLDQIAKATEPLSKAVEPNMVPGVGPINAAEGAGVAALSKIKGVINSLKGLLEGSGISVPAFANGALAYGPTLAMVGDNRGASTDPEVIAPFSKIEGLIERGGGSDNREVIAVLKLIHQAIKSSGSNDQVTMNKTDLARAAASGINDLNRRSGRSTLTV